mgnify:CR=1 FL=1
MSDLDKANTEALFKILIHADFIHVSLGGKGIAMDPKMFRDLHDYIDWSKFDAAQA